MRAGICSMCKVRPRRLTETLSSGFLKYGWYCQECADEVARKIIEREQARRNKKKLAAFPEPDADGWEEV